MRITYKKTLAVLLAVLLAALCALPAAAAVSMPAGYTEQQVEAAIPKADALVKALMQTSSEMPDVKKTVYGMLYADETLSALFSEIYTAFDENRSTLSALGLDFSVQRVADALQGFPGVYAVLNGQTDWAAVLPKAKDLKWNVSDRAAFGAALSGMLAPLNDLLFALLCGGSYQITRLVSVTGANGYENALVPLLRSLGCPSVMTQASFTADAQKDRYAMVKDLANMLLDALDNMLETPVQSLCAYLPGIAYYLKNGGLSGTLSTLMEPLKLKIAVFTLPGVSRLMENTDMFSSGMDLSAMLSKADLGAVTGSDAELQLPEIDLDALAACGSAQVDGSFVPNKAQAFITILYWVFDAARQNAGALPSDFASFSSFLKKDNAALAVVVLKILHETGTPKTLEYTWVYPAHTAGTAPDVAGLSRENVVRMLDMIDGTLNEFLVEFTDMGDLESLVKKSVYSSRLVTELAAGVYGALYTPETAQLGALLGIDASPAGVAAAVRRSYPAAARTLANCSSWEKVKTNGVSWGFADGSRDGFVNAVTAVLTPLAPVLRFLLAEGSMRLFDAVTLGGSNGYNTAVVPLLEGLGCDPQTIVPYETYKASADSALITNLLKPLTALLDSLGKTPVRTLCSLLPELAYFMTSEQPAQCLKNLLYPVTQTLADLGLSELLPSQLTDMELPDVQTLLSSVTAGTGLDMELPAPDLKLLASLGVAEQRESRRVINGGKAQYTYIAADEPAVLVTLLRYVLGAAKGADTSGLLAGFSMGGSPAESGMDMSAVYTEKVTAQLKEMTADETIVWLYDLLFAETPKKETSEKNVEIPTIIYEEQPDHTARNRVIATAVVLALFTGLIIFFVKYDFGQAKARRKRKREKRKRLRQTPPVPRRAGAPSAAECAPAEQAISAKARRRAFRETKKADRYYDISRRA